VGSLFVAGIHEENTFEHKANPTIPKPQSLMVIAIHHSILKHLFLKYTFLQQRFAVQLIHDWFVAFLASGITLK